MIVVKNGPRRNDTSSLPARDISGPRLQEWNALLPDFLKGCQYYFEYYLPGNRLDAPLTEQSSEIRGSAKFTVLAKAWGALLATARNAVSPSVVGYLLQ